ncbi:MAG: energy-coupling factor transporter transmembrane protein EcfT [Firmicutes bacterium]|nr:energy-coupling factor transporter transmembrane protein EcfT [Bacillota bacterium]
MRAPSLYVPGRSFVHRADPLTKAAWAFSTALAGFIVPDWRATAALLVLNLTLLGLAGALRRTARLILASAVLVATFFVAQGLSHPSNAEPLFRVFGLTFYREGLLVAWVLALRLWNTIAAIGVLVFTVRPQDLVTALLMRGLSPRAGYALVSIIQVLPTLSASVATILDAQRSRGVETEGGLRVRLRALLPMLAPLIMSALAAAQDRAVALEVRGFSRPGPRTILRPVRDMAGAAFWRAVGLGVLVAAVLWRALGG